MLYILSPLLELLILGAIIYVIVRAVRGRSRDPLRPADGDIARRLFLYGMVFAALIVASIGLTGLLERALTAADARSDDGLAATIALSVVGLPVYVALARYTWRRLSASVREREAVGWTLYLSGALVTSLAVTAGGLIGLISRALDGTGYDGALLAMVIVWGSVWVAHWYVWLTMRPVNGADVQLIIGSGIGLTLLASGLGFALAEAGQLAFDAAADTAVGRGNGDELITAGVAAAVGAAVWVWHWVVHSVRLERTVLWLAYVLLYGVLGGLIATLVGAGRSLFLVLEWLYGDPSATSAIDHYRGVSPALAASIAGVLVWRYHTALVGPRRARPRTNVDRTYDAIVSGTALATVAAALVILVVALFRLASPAAAASGESGGDVLLAAITLLVIGGPVWAATWLRMQRHAHDGADEVNSVPRRSYLFSVLGVTGAVAFGSLIAVLVVVFESWLGERTGGLNEPLQWPVALLLTAGAIALYHFVVFRAEKPLHEERPHRDVLLVWGADGHAGEIAAATHADIRVLHRTDYPDAEVDPTAVSHAIDAAAGDHLIVVAGPEGILVVPYELVS